MLWPQPNAEVLCHAHAKPEDGAMALEVSQPVGLPFSSVRPIVVDGGEHGAHERAVLCEVVVRPRHELPADPDAGGREVQGPDLRSEEDEVLGGAEALLTTAISSGERP